MCVYNKHVSLFVPFPETIRENLSLDALLLVYFNIWLTTFKRPIWLTLVCSRRHVDPGNVT